MAAANTGSIKVNPERPRFFEHFDVFLLIGLFEASRDTSKGMTIFIADWSFSTTFTTHLNPMDSKIQRLKFKFQYSYFWLC
ncbi:MAG: hypothetical protein ABL933_13165 [Methyloglobulus sp.]